MCGVVDSNPASQCQPFLHPKHGVQSWCAADLGGSRHDCDAVSTQIVLLGLCKSVSPQTLPCSADVPPTFEERVKAVESASRFQDEAPAMLREAKEDTEDLKTRVSAVQPVRGTWNHSSTCNLV